QERHQGLPFLVERAVFVVQAEGLVEQHLHQFDHDARAEEQADALDDAWAEIGDEGNELEFADAQGGRGYVDSGFEAALAEGKQAGDALPVTAKLALAEM